MVLNTLLKKIKIKKNNCFMQYFTYDVFKQNAAFDTILQGDVKSSENYLKPNVEALIRYYHFNFMCF